MITPREIRAALNSIDNNKSPGVDGYSLGFFKDTWDITGPDFSAAVLEFFHHGKMPRAANSTLITLIPKTEAPHSVTEFRPISCCTVFYKKVSKILANRMKTLLGEIVDDLLDFTRGDLPLIQTVDKCLSIFPGYSGLRVNPMKSNLYFGGVNPQLKQLILQTNGYIEGELPVRYLGIPLFGAMLTQSVFIPMMDKIRTKISHWANKCLSYADKIALINSVIFGIQNFCGASILLPKGIAMKFHKLCKDFL
ncbi:uncharacterized protein LOC141608050 [Silene latifolia]|uniref:uncharacterized protein LOC141608050 n=1 Tax=Silene latifolia TaxID=37657 RepID=UPI003D775715